MTHITPARTSASVPSPAAPSPSVTFHWATGP
jgi:hypothetical protein